MSKDNDGFKKIVHISNWGDWERLGGEDGEELVDGSACIVRWPDGSETREKLKYHKGSQQISDMGRSYSGLDEHSYVDAKFRGVKIRLPLRGLMVRILKKPTARAAK